MEGKFWKKSYDEGVDDLDPSVWEISFLEAIKPAFEKNPNGNAILFMGVGITYSELDLYSNRIANLLVSCGLKKGDVVAINLPNIPEYLISWLGILKAGCVVSGLSPLLSTEEMAYQLKDSDAKAIVTLDAIFAGRLVHIEKNLPELEVVLTASVGGFMSPIKRFLGKLIKKIPTGKVTPLNGKIVKDFYVAIKTDAYPSTPSGVEIGPDDLAYLQYTGGTTGHPKGALLTHRNAVSDLLLLQKWLGWYDKPHGVALSGFPFFHIAGLFFNTNCMLIGWTQVLIPNPRDTDHICSEIKKYRPSALVNVPSLFQMLIANPKFRELDHSNLEICITAASPFPIESQKELESIVGEGKLIEGYGMTETSPLITMNPAVGKKKYGCIGLPLPNTDIKLIDPETREEVAVGEPGEICVKGPQVMDGYYKKTEETEHVIDKDGYLHTGDVAIQDEEGYLRIVDRTKDMIIVSGFKVFSKRVEEVLTSHPAIDMIALVGKENPARPGSELVKAYMTVSPEYKDKEGVQEDVLAYAKDKLSPYEVPKDFEVREELPLTAVGKIDKKKLR